MENQATDPLDDEEVKKTLKSVKTFLEPYYELTKKMCAAEATCSLLLAGGKLLLVKTESTSNDLRTRSKHFGSILLMKIRRQVAPSFAHETLRIAALFDPRFAFLESIASGDEWTTTVEKLIEFKMGHSSSSQDSFDFPTSTAMDKVTSFWDPIADYEHDSAAKSLARIIYGNKRRARLCGESAGLLLMCKSHVNREIARECKRWSAAEMRRYRNVDENDDDDEDSSSVESLVEDKATASDEDIDDLEETKETL